MRRHSAAGIEIQTLGMMVKYWEAGTVKTRLGSSVGMRRSAEIHRLFVQHLCTTLAGVLDRRSLCLSPGERRDEVARQLRPKDTAASWQIVDQGGGDLGQRMQRWFTGQLPDRSAAAILIGADCPLVSPPLIKRAASELLVHDLVIGPAVDGGYYLIGIRGCDSADGSAFRPLFSDIAWSTDAVLSQTRKRATELTMSIAELPPQEDVDTVVELQNLLNRLDNNDHQQAGLKQAIEHLLADRSWDDCE